MKRTSIVGLCLFAGFTFTATISSTAYAGEWGVCKLLTKETTPKAKHGWFTESNCQTVYTKKGKEEARGSYEFFPGPHPSCVAARKGEYTNSDCTEKAAMKGRGKFEREPCYGSGNGCAELHGSTGVVELSTEVGTVRCSAGTYGGVTTGATSGKRTFSFTGCEAFGAKCTSLNGAKEGEITTYEVEGRLIDNGETGLGGKEPKTLEVWEQFANQHGAEAPWIMKFGCAGVGYFEVDGSFSGKLSPINVMTASWKGDFEAGVGEQDVLVSVCTSPEYKECPAENLPSTVRATEPECASAPRIIAVPVYPVWNPEKTYKIGDRVEFEALIYESLTEPNKNQTPSMNGQWKVVGPA
jgi:hypothetical protein